MSFIGIFTIHIRFLAHGIIRLMSGKQMRVHHQHLNYLKRNKNPYLIAVMVCLLYFILNFTELCYYCTVSTQTNLSFPSILPDHVEEILKPYFINSVNYFSLDIYIKHII